MVEFASFDLDAMMLSFTKKLAWVLILRFRFFWVPGEEKRELVEVITAKFMKDIENCNASSITMNIRDQVVEVQPNIQFTQADGKLLTMISGNEEV